MAVPKKRKFARRSVSKVVRFNLVCKKKNYSVGLQPELKQVTIKSYFFLSLYSALFSSLYAFSLPMLEGLNSRCTSYTSVYALCARTSFLFRGLRYFSFGSSLFVFNKSAVYIRSVPSLPNTQQSVVSSCL